MLDCIVTTCSGRRVKDVDTFILLQSKITTEIQTPFAKAVYAFGHNQSNSLGAYHCNPIDTPCDIISMRRKLISKIVGGPSFTFVLTKFGALYSLGSNDNYVLGYGDKESLVENVPKRVQVLIKHVVVDIACGDNHVLAVTADGHCYAWGKGARNGLGHGDAKNRKRPRLIKGLENKNVKRVFCGASTNISESFAITDKGELYCWGESVATPVHCTSVSNVRLVAAAYGIRIVVDDKGVLHYMQFSRDVNTLNSRYRSFASDEIFVDAKACETLVVLLTKSKRIYFTETSSITGSFQLKLYGALTNVISISCGRSQVAAIKKDGSVWQFPTTNTDGLNLLGKDKGSASTLVKKNLLGRKAFSLGSGPNNFFALCEQ